MTKKSHDIFIPVSVPLLRSVRVTIIIPTMEEGKNRKGNDSKLTVHVSVCEGLYSHMFSCRMKLAMLLCLKNFGRISLEKRPWSNTWKLFPL